MPAGYLSLVLHGHLPYVRHPEHEYFLEENWFFEALTDTYLPLLDVFEGLVCDGIPFRLKAPHKAFNRKIGSLAGLKVSPDGKVVNDAEWNFMRDQWLATDEDRAFVASLMGRVVDAGKFANWIAPPPMGINRQSIEFEYVRFN